MENTGEPVLKNEFEILIETLTRTQLECTRLLEENRTLSRCLATGWGLEDAIAAVKAFHEKFGVPVLDSPQFPDASKIKLKIALVEEEIEELMEAISNRSMEHVADGIADSIYVLIGMALSFGIPLDEVWTEVHQTNMKKVGGKTREDGKILKPEGWVGPKIKEILDSYK